MRTHLKGAVLLPLILTLASCGYVGEPLPPSLNIAKPIADLRAVEYADRLLIDFTIPALTTDGTALTKIKSVDLRIGATVTPFDAGRWSAEAKPIAVSRNEPGAVHASLPAGDWVGKDIVIGVRILNNRGRASNWSNLVAFRVSPPVAKPTDVKAEPDKQGVKVSWTSAASKFRVFRQASGQEQPALLSPSDRPEFIDKTAEYGKTYAYIVQALEGDAESEVTAAVSVLHRDVDPPAAPAALQALAGVGTIELTWDRNTEPDLRGYRVYRAAEGADFAVVIEFIDTPAFSDRQIESGKKYRYAVSAIDTAGNESPRSTPVEVTAP